MGRRPLSFFYSFSEGIVFRRQILPSKDVPLTVRVKELFPPLLIFIIIIIIFSDCSSFSVVVSTTMISEES